MNAKLVRRERKVAVNTHPLEQLTVIWEMEAHAFDVIRTQSLSAAEQDALRYCAEIYRRCASDLDAKLKKLQ